MLGKLDWSAIPIHEPIPLVAAGAVLVIVLLTGLSLWLLLIMVPLLGSGIYLQIAGSVSSKSLG